MGFLRDRRQAWVIHDYHDERFVTASLAVNWLNSRVSPA